MMPTAKNMSALPTGERASVRHMRPNWCTRPEWAASPSAAVPEISVERSFTCPALCHALTEEDTTPRATGPRGVQSVVQMTSAGAPRRVTDSSSKLVHALPSTTTLRSAAPSGGRRTILAVIAPPISNRSVAGLIRRSE
jgi:hypothetical protein